MIGRRRGECIVSCYDKAVGRGMGKAKEVGEADKVIDCSGMAIQGRRAYGTRVGVS
jgi:hypothetical protein